MTPKKSRALQLGPPEGQKKDSKSFSEIIREIGNRTGPEFADLCPFASAEQLRPFRQLPPDVTILQFLKARAAGAAHPENSDKKAGNSGDTRPLNGGT